MNIIKLRDCVFKSPRGGLGVKTYSVTNLFRINI